MKRFLSFIIAITLLSSLFTIPSANLMVSASEYNGQLGNNLTWAVNTDTGVLTTSFLQHNGL